MANQEVDSPTAKIGWNPAQVYVLAAICLLLGVALGYLFRGSASPSPVATVQTESTQPAQAAPKMPSLEEMKHMADKKAEPILAQLKTDPNNTDLLKHVAKIYESTHQFKEAAGYYEKVINLNPKDIPARTEMASCLYYTGDVEGALNQLHESLKIDPKNANSLFNLGMIRWKGKNDQPGALAAWRELLKSNPKLEPEKKTQVEKLIADASQQSLPTKNAQ